MIVINLSTSVYLLYLNQSFFGDFFLFWPFLAFFPPSNFWNPHHRPAPTKPKKTEAYKNLVDPESLWNEIPNILISFSSEACPEACLSAYFSSLLMAISSSNCLMNLTIPYWFGVKGVSRVSATAA
jgi:hypothetical protein